MPRVCSICTHDQRQAIDRALLAGESFRNIAERFGTSTTGLHRHKGEHLPKKLTHAHAAKEVADADDLLAQLKALRTRAVSILQKAEAAGDYRTALAGIREARACIETLMEVEGELDRRRVTNIIVSPQWIDLRGRILQTVAPYPEARAALVAALGAANGHDHG